MQLHDLASHYSKIPIQELKPAMLRARQKAIKAVEEITINLKDGMNEVQARKLAMEIFNDHGTKKHWHQVFVRFASGSLLGFKDQPQETNFFNENDLVMIDVGPVFFDDELQIDIESDYGDTFQFNQQNNSYATIINFGQALFNETLQLWQNKKYTGQQLANYLDQQCQHAGYELSREFSGHALSDFPHRRYLSSNLYDHDFYPRDSLWMLELKVHCPKLQRGFFREDLLFN